MVAQPPCSLGRIMSPQHNFAGQLDAPSFIDSWPAGWLADWQCRHGCSLLLFTFPATVLHINAVFVLCRNEQATTPIWGIILLRMCSFCAEYWLVSLQCCMHA